MDPRAKKLLDCFVSKLGGDVQVGVRRGAGRSEYSESFTVVTEVVKGFDPAQGIVELELPGGQPVRLHFTEAELLDLLDGAASSAVGVWTEPLSDEEAAARFLTVFFDESVICREPSPSGWWEYQDQGFVPQPPWEAFAR